MIRLYQLLATVAASLLVMTGLQADTGAYRPLGYMYLSPLPGAEYTPTQTKFVLVRFKDIAPTVVTNLAQFIQVSGASSGIHSGTTKIASDLRTVIFEMSSSFQSNELVTVSLSPQTPTAVVQPYQYTFMITGHMPDPPTITASGDNSPNETKEKAFDGNVNTKWSESVVPNGSTVSSWIQYLYPGTGTHYVTQYTITSANDLPARDPKDWRFYGVDAAGSLTLLDTRTNQVFASRGLTSTFAITSTTAYRGYRLQITKVADPTTAGAVQLAELAFIEPSILREYWSDISGTAVSDLTSNANYPNSPTGSSQLTSFEAPTDWADNYGTRVRGYITAPTTGSYVFWIASDDNSELWLSTNSDPANKTKIAYVQEWTNSQEWSKYGGQKSAAISLVAGQKYYVEALQKEGGGGDNLAVGWAKPGQPTTSPSEVIPGWVLTPWIVTASITPQAPTPASPMTPSVMASPGVAGLMPNGVSVPSNFPHITITTNNNPCADPIFIDNRGGGGQCYNVIFDNTGSPIWYQRMPDERRDMKVQPNGVLTLLARDKGQYFYGMNTHYEKIAEYWTTNGYSVDEHELQMLADGTYFLIGLNYQSVDLSRYVSGAGTSVGITEDCIQQFTPAGELIFQWRAWDHLDPAGQNTVVGATNPGDFTHMNAIAVDSDGHILLSSRNTSEITKINADTGEIIWRLGGTHNQFTYVNDSLGGQRNQHAIRPLGNNHYTMFDNGNGHSPQVSRGVEYVVDPVAMTATLVWQYLQAPTNLFTYYMGNVQRLSNGNTLINWVIGGYPKLTEVRPDGTKAFEMNWVSQYEAYRVWRCPWQGVALKPYLILESYPDNMTLLFNQFGDTNVAAYRIYAGTSPQPTTLIGSSTTTMKSFNNLVNGQRYYFRVTAVDKNGVEGASSNEENAVVNIIKPGQNMVANGDFSGGTASWTWALTSPAVATLSTSSGYSRFNITNAGSTVSNVQLRQAGMQLVQGKKYIFEFDAWADTARSIEAKVGQDVSPYTNYSGIGYTSVTTTKTHYRYTFTMTAANDLSSRVVINTGKLGTSTASVNIDNVSLFTPAPGDLNEDGKVDLLDLKIMSSAWRKQQTGLSSDLNGDGKVDFNDFGVLGDNWSGTP
ncbi:MAG: aryl-sulfate sulfotransferase [Verrucomicrobiota bacterium]